MDRVEAIESAGNLAFRVSAAKCLVLGDPLLFLMGFGFPTPTTKADPPFP